MGSAHILSLLILLPTLFRVMGSVSKEYFTHRYMSVGSTHLYPYPYPYLYPSTQRVEVLTL
jgi:hypothetical protein